MHHYVYRITNTTLKKHYYGKRSSKHSPAQDLGVKYFSSSTDKAFKQDQKDNSQNYRYKVVRVFETAAEAVAFETMLHHKFQVAKNSAFYNRANQTGNGFDTTGQYRPLAEATKKKISQAHKGRVFTNDHKEKLRLAKLGKVLPSEHRAKISKGNIGKHQSEQTKQLISVAKKGKPLTVSHKEASKRARNSDEVNAKLRACHMKAANIYNASTHELIANNVCLSEWCRQHGYSQGNLACTANIDQHIRDGKPIRKQHKGIYARYI